MENNIFSTRRFLRTLRWDLLTNKKSIIRLTVGMTFALSLFYLYVTWSYGNGQPFMGNAFYDNTIVDMEIFSFVMAGFASVLCAGLLFANMKTKQQRTAFLTLPASNLEKWLVRMAYVTVVAWAMMAAALVAADLIRFVFALFLSPGHYASVAWGVLTDFFFDWPDPFAATVCLFSFMVFNHSFYALGGALFRRQPVMMTMACQFAIGLVLMMFGMQYTLKLILDAMEHVERNDISADEAQRWLEATAWEASAVFTLLSALCYWGSYKLFTRMQVINNKWLNI